MRRFGLVSNGGLGEARIVRFRSLGLIGLNIWRCSLGRMGVEGGVGEMGACVGSWEWVAVLEVTAA